MAAPLILHATTVAWRGRAVLIRGASGSGKSSLGLELMAWGARLVADDRTELRAGGHGQVIARCPAAIRGLIEARGLGLLEARAVEEAVVALVVDLDRIEPERLPPWREEVILGVPLPCVHKPESGHFAAGILQYLKSGRSVPATQRPT
ncbi:HPr kinase/phosphorylase [Rubellimicrobium arenae]|uniref:HPr kinase/phosphorylase n=1 Tax=Rubellimicrobium arenae TaxID=2817372 RepID=UPI001B3065E8|nr:serine kinase [Rubellimicrobium arenae]